MDFRTLLNAPGFVRLDGAMGTMLQRKGLPVGMTPELAGLEHPDWLLEIHRAYLAAGAQVATANTFGASALKLAGTGCTPETVIAANVSLARQAVGDRALVALDIGPLGQLLEPTGTLRFDDAYDCFAQMVRAGAKAGADLVLLETMTDLYEVKAALLAVKENSSLPVICTMTFEDNRRTFLGCDLPSMALTLEGLGADAIGVNCSLGPREFPALLEELARWTSLPLVAQPNAGLPDPGGKGYDITPEEFADSMADLARLGVKCLGGCCGTDPAYIALTGERLDKLTYRRSLPQVPAAVCSGTRTVSVDRVRIIGERINPTGKKRFKEALLREDMDYILDQALQQTGAGADLLDVNVGLPEIDEPAMMVRTVKALQGVTDAPLQLDSSDRQALEAGLRAYNGKPIVNSVNGDDQVLDALLPLVKKYGAAVVGLTLDRDGIPKTAEERLAVARHILDKALTYGIRREDVYIDCLTLTVSAEPQAAAETLKAVALVKEELGLKTVLGVSNISFGLPGRPLINQNFLTMAMTHGLDLPILNPNVEAMTAAVRCYHLLTNQDADAKAFITAYGGTPAAPSPAPAAGRSLADTVIHGLKGEAHAAARALLETTAPMEVVNGVLIPALDKVGADFEAGRIFLPQLIQAAGAAQAAFEVVRERLSSDSGGETASRGTIVLATVQGDIHDIGKNIVKVLLENYGYTVVDLGRDVDPAAVAEAVRRHEAPLVGLSALMTTTLGSMEKTITLLHEEGLSCRVMVGGAVLTPDYARKMGADFYSGDAKESVDIAKRIFG